MKQRPKGNNEKLNSYDKEKETWWLCGLEHSSEAAWLIGSWNQILLRAWVFVSFV
jgi:hypothetical protein